MLERMKKGMENVMRYFLVLFSIYIIAVSVAEPKICYDSMLRWVVILAAAYVVLLYGVWKVCGRVPERYLRYLGGVSIIIVLLIQLYIVSKMQLVPDVDLCYVYDQCVTMLEQNTHYLTDREYFGFYTNNIPICIVIYRVFRFGKWLGCENYRLIGGVFNVLILCEVYCVAWQIIKRVTNIRTAVVFLFFLLTNPNYYAYAAYYYTDTVSLGFLMPGVLCLYYGFRQKDVRRQLLLFFAAGFLIGAASKIRVTSIFILLAVAVVLVWRKYWKNMALSCLGVICGLGVFALVWSGVYHYHIDFDTRDSSVTVEHYLMMASKNFGVYDDEAVMFTQSLPTHEEKVVNARAKWIENIRNNGVAGNLRLVLRKEASVWGLFLNGYVQYTQFVVKASTCYHLISGKDSVYFRSFIQAYNAVFFLLIGLGVLACRDRRDDMLVLSVYLLGAIVFYMFWEGNSRHSVSLMVLLSFLITPFVEKMSAYRQRGERPLQKFFGKQMEV